MTGRPWNVESRHDKFENADARRGDLLAGSQDLQVKVKRTAEGIFTVRTRSLESEASKKKGKNKPKTPPTGKPKTRSEKRKLREKKRTEKSSSA